MGPERLAGAKQVRGGDVVTAHTSDNPRAATVLASVPGVQTRTTDDGTLIIETPHGDRVIPTLMDLLRGAAPPIQVESIGLSRPTLEDVFVKLTGHAIRAAEADAAESFRQMAQMWNGRRSQS